MHEGHHYTALQYSYKKYKPAIRLLPFYSLGFSDNRHFRLKGIPVFDFFRWLEHDRLSLTLCQASLIIRNIIMNVN